MALNYCLPNKVIISVYQQWKENNTSSVLVLLFQILLSHGLRQRDLQGREQNLRVRKPGLGSGVLSLQSSEKYITYNFSLETFLWAIKNFSQVYYYINPVRHKNLTMFNRWRQFFRETSNWCKIAQLSDEAEVPLSCLRMTPVGGRSKGSVWEMQLSLAEIKEFDPCWRGSLNLLCLLPPPTPLLYIQTIERLFLLFYSFTIYWFQILIKVPTMCLPWFWAHGNRQRRQ